jgi:hypothetical protein
VCQDVGGAGGALPDVEGIGDFETFLASVEVEAGNGVATIPSDSDVEAGVEAMAWVETGVDDDDDTIARANAGGETSVGGMMEAD